MIPVSIIPVVQGYLGNIYLIGVVVLTSAFFMSALPLAREKSNKNALLLLKASVFYLPILLLIIIIDLGVGIVCI